MSIFVTPRETTSPASAVVERVMDAIEQAFRDHKTPPRVVHRAGVFSEGRDEQVITLDGCFNLELIARAAIAALASPTPRDTLEDVVERVASIIAPDWFPDNDSHHVLNNYPGQADKFRSQARDKAREIVTALASPTTKLSR